jgi:hypothetical protein
VSIHAHVCVRGDGKDERVNTTTKHPLIAPLLLAAATVGTWAACLSWQTGYRTDAETGAVSGPYSWWQVAGCVLTLAVVAGVAGRRLGPLRTIPIMSVAFTAAWATQAAASDETGLWVVGAILVLFGTAAGAAVVSVAARQIRRPNANAH